MGKRKDLNDFEKGQIVMARRLGQSISQTAGLVGCSRYAVVSTYQKWSKEGQPVNRRQGHGRPRLIDARGERRLARLVRSHRTATVAQIAEKVNAGFDRKVSEHTVHRSLLRMGLRNRRPGRKRSLQERGSEPAGQEWSGEEEEEEEDYHQPLNQEPDGVPNTQQEQNDEATHAEQLQEVQERIEVTESSQGHSGEEMEVWGRATDTMKSTLSTDWTGNETHLQEGTEQTPLLKEAEAMGLFLPQPPAPDSDDEEDPEGAAARRSHVSISTDPDHVELVKRTMAAVNLPSLGIPPWARGLSDDQWKDMVDKTLQSRQSSAGFLLQPK